jgi:hypothetical protein
MNNLPIQLSTPRLSVSGTTFVTPITLAANDYDGAGANNVLVFTAGANGSFLQKLKLKAVGTNIATVLRVFMNNGLTPATASNNVFFDELALPATTASSSSSTSPPVEMFINIAIPAGFRVYVGLGTAVASGWVVTPVGGDY